MLCETTIKSNLKPNNDVYIKIFRKKTYYFYRYSNDDINRRNMGNCLLDQYIDLNNPAIKKPRYF